MESIIIQAKTRKHSEKELYKKYRDRFIAKSIYNVGAFIFWVIGGALDALIAVFLPHLLFPNVEFHIYCAMVLVTGFIAIFPVVVLGCLAKMGIYKLLCMLTRK